jgi:GNAT superfamily N-acetyltransferase
MPDGIELTEAAIRTHWLAQRNMVEFLAAQPDSRYWIAESDGALAGFARVVRFQGMEELTELMVDPAHQREGIGRALLDRV